MSPGPAECSFQSNLLDREDQVGTQPLARYDSHSRHHRSLSPTSTQRLSQHSCALLCCSCDRAACPTSWSDCVFLHTTSLEERRILLIRWLQAYYRITSHSSSRLLRHSKAPHPFLTTPSLSIRLPLPSTRLIQRPGPINILSKRYSHSHYQSSPTTHH